MYGPHQAADEHHRQQRRDDGERRDDGRVADFGDALDRGLDQAALAAHAPVAHDVLDHDDGVVDEDADGEDQREQADAVDRVAHHPGREQRQQDRRRHDDEGDDALAPADRHDDQRDDRAGGEREMEQKLVGLVVGGRAVVARHLDVEARRNEAALDAFEPLKRRGGDIDRILALALGDGEADGGAAVQFARGVARQRPGAVVEFRRADDDLRHVLDVDRSPVARREQQQPDVGHALQGLAGDDRLGASVLAERPGEEGAVGVLDLADDLFERHAVERELLRVRLDANLGGRAADDEGLADAAHLRQFVLQLLGDQIEPVVASTRPPCRPSPTASAPGSARR